MAAPYRWFGRSVTPPIKTNRRGLGGAAVAADCRWFGNAGHTTDFSVWAGVGYNWGVMIAFETLVFYFFAVVAVAVALGVILARNPVHAALFLVVAFVAAAGLWLLLAAEFLAIVLVLVYVGAVMVLFLFVLMMLDINFERIREGFWRYLPLAVLVAAVFIWQVVQIVTESDFAPTNAAANLSDLDNTRALGEVLYTDYVYPFELAAAILLVAIVAAVALTLRRKRPANKSIAPDVQARAPKRVRLVSTGDGSEVDAAAAENTEETTQAGARVL